MSRQKPKRTKKYTPREVQADPISWAVAGVHKFPSEKIAQCLAPVNAEFLCLKRGTASRDDWNQVSTALNIAEALAGLHIGPNLMPKIEKGQHALHKIALRMLEFGDKACKAPELANIAEAMAIYKAQLQLCTQAEMSRAVQRVKRLIEGGAMKVVEKAYNGMAA